MNKFVFSKYIMDYKQKYIIYKQKYLNLKQNQTNNKKNIDDIVDSKTKLFTDALKGKIPICNLSITDARKLFSDIQVDESYKNNVDIETINIATKINEIQLNIFRPKDNKDVLPVIIFYHGCGWIMGNARTHGRLMSNISIMTNTAVVYVGYTPAPEKKYPTQLIQAYDALMYVVNNSGKHNFNINKLILMGDDVGATMTIVISMLSTERRGPKISYLILLYPFADASMNSESFQTYHDGPWMNKRTFGNKCF
ncbi:putative alpha/beta hydrolase [Tupanvirus soda lake]|uniref:Alpha/beta hydrolase n=2 Tax=Tupanvirus TaxID=2094720 RepID=A0AC62AB66_9VIRU|nr:putative alpha/beta hydrolase [Tupanvirus soda lake]QKU34979.1 putative alpha/beta hydrolase [Tupanvirus soda lake]